MMTLLKLLWKIREVLRVLRNEKQKETRRRYEMSDKGKAARKRHEATYVTSGKRVVLEAKRAEKPVSELRKQAKLKYQLMRRSGEQVLDDFCKWVLLEAIQLAKQREKLCGGSWHVDHITPVSKGGQSTHDNIQVVPAYWNRSKSNKHTKRFFACA